MHAFQFLLFVEGRIPEDITDCRKVHQLCRIESTFNCCIMHTFGYRALHVRYDLFLTHVSWPVCCEIAHSRTQTMNICSQAYPCLSANSGMRSFSFTRATTSPQCRAAHCKHPPSQCVKGSQMGLWRLTITRRPREVYVWNS